MTDSKIGRPSWSPSNKSEFEQMVFQGATATSLTKYYKVNNDTITAYCRREYGETFSEFSERMKEKEKHTLINMAFKLAQKNGAVMIFLLKNICGFTDKVTEEPDMTLMNAFIEQAKKFNEVKGDA